MRLRSKTASCKPSIAASLPWFALLLLPVLADSAAADGIQYVTTLNEDGIASFMPLGGQPNTKMNLVFSMAHDPLSPPNFPAAPMFSVPANLAADFTENITPGDVVIAEPQITAIESDLVRFERIAGLPGDKNGGANVIFFYSDKDGDTDKSDVGLPPVGAKFVLIPEDMGGPKPGIINYTPTGNQPGGLATDPANALRYEYIINSDCSDTCVVTPSPEPSTLLFALTGACSLLAFSGVGRTTRYLRISGNGNRVPQPANEPLCIQKTCAIDKPVSVSRRRGRQPFV